MEFLEQLFDTNTDFELEIDEQKIRVAEFEIRKRIYSLQACLMKSYDTTTFMTLNKELKTLTMLHNLRADYHKLQDI